MVYVTNKPTYELLLVGGSLCCILDGMVPWPLQTCLNQCILWKQTHTFRLEKFIYVIL